MRAQCSEQNNAPRPSFGKNDDVLSCETLSMPAHNSLSNFSCTSRSAPASATEDLALLTLTLLLLLLLLTLTLLMLLAPCLPPPPVVTSSSSAHNATSNSFRHKHHARMAVKLP